MTLEISHFSNVVDECYAIENNKLISSKSHNPILSFNHDEADTLLIWFSIYCKAEYGTNITIELICSDNDVLLLCLNYAMKLPYKTLLCTISGCFCIGVLREAIGEVKCKALSTLHSITGCDKTGRFFGIGKLTWLKLLMASEDEELFVSMKEFGETDKFTDHQVDVLSKIHFNSLY